MPRFTAMTTPVMFTLASDLTQMELQIDIDEADIGVVREGQTATFTVDAFPGRLFNATVKQIRMAPQVVSNVVTYTVVLKTTNPDGILLPGMTVLANIVTRRTPESMTVPLAALRYRPRTLVASAREDAAKPSDSIWVLRDGKPVLLPVVRGDEDSKNVVVKSEGLRPTDLVILREKDAAGQRALGGS